MKRLLLCSAVFVAVVTSVFAQKLPEWQDTEIVEVNREDPHASRFSFDSMEKAVNGDIQASSNYLTLNGTWKFQWSPNPDSRPVNPLIKELLPIFTKLQPCNWMPYLKFSNEFQFM